jgi:hypothetical protein
MDFIKVRRWFVVVAIMGSFTIIGLVKHLVRALHQWGLVGR